jgi:hypothetical protein
MAPRPKPGKHGGAVCPAGGAKLHVRGLRSHQSSTDRLVAWFVQLSLLAVWKSLATLSRPVGRVLAMYVWAGKSLLKLASWGTRLVLRLTGWLASPAFPHSKWLRQWSRHSPWPLDVRKWHVAVGEPGVWSASIRSPHYAAAAAAANPKRSCASAGGWHVVACLPSSSAQALSSWLAVGCWRSSRQGPAASLDVGASHTPPPPTACPG